MKIETSSIAFKPFQKLHIMHKPRWLNNPNVNRFVGNEPGKRTNIKKETEWFESYKKDKNKKFFIILCNNKPIGYMGFSNISKINGTADASIIVGEDDYRGKGIGQKSFEYLINYGFQNLHLQKINLGVLQENKSAINLYKKLGFGKEGVLKREVFFDGKFHNQLLMAKFKEL